MNRKVIWILFITIVFSPLFSRETKLPDWFYNVPQEDGFLYAIGISDECGSIAEAHSQADERGQALMSVLYKSRVFGEVKNYEEYDSTFVNCTLALLRVDTKVTADLIAGISLETAKRFDYGKHVSISLCKMNLNNVNFIKDIKVFARVYEAESFDSSGIVNNSYLEFFVYNSIHPKTNGLFHLTKDEIVEALYKQFKASEAFKELEKDLGEETEGIDLKPSNNNENKIIETENKSEDILLAMPADEIIDEKLWLEFPISSISVTLESMNNKGENTQKYFFHSKTNLNRKSKNDTLNQVSYPKWFFTQNNAEQISFYGSGSFDNPKSNLAAVYLKSLIDALKVNAEYLKTEVKGMEKDYPEMNLCNKTVTSSFDEILRMNMITRTDFSRQFNDNQNLYIQIKNDKNRAKMQRIKEEEKLYEEFKKSKAFKK